MAFLYLADGSLAIACLTSSSKADGTELFADRALGVGLVVCRMAVATGVSAT